MKKVKGFSLIELLIVIAIMAILGSLGLAAFSTARKQGRDTVRKSDMSQYKVALEQYYSANGSYPLAASVINSESSWATLNTALGSYMGGDPPRGFNIPEKKYYYISNGSSYTVFANLEVGSCWAVCSNGMSGDTGQLCSNITTVTCPL